MKLKADQEKIQHPWTLTFLKRKLIFPARLKVVQRHKQLGVLIRRGSEQVLSRGPPHRAVEAAAAAATSETRRRQQQ